MKKIYAILIALFVFLVTDAQIISTLVLSTQPPAQLSEWGSRKEVLTLIIRGQAGFVPNFKVKVEISTSDGTVIGFVDLARAPIFTGNSAGNTILYAADVLPLELMQFSGKYKTSLQRTGKLPADNYILCLQPVRPDDFFPLGEKQCKTFYMATTQLPILLKPYHEEVLDGKIAQTAITFRWSPVVPNSLPLATYRLQVFEILPTQSPVQALRSNQPLLDKEVKGTTQLIWQPQLSFIPINDNNSPNKYIWTIQTLDNNGNPITQTDGSGEARSEPIIFFVDLTKGVKVKN